MCGGTLSSIKNKRNKKRISKTENYSINQIHSLSHSFDKFFFRFLSNFLIISREDRGVEHKIKSKKKVQLTSILFSLDAKKEVVTANLSHLLCVRLEK